VLGSLMASSTSSTCTVLSSIHGRLRRKQREISTSELQAAVKYGLRTPANPDNDGKPRWKYMHNDIVYITDETSRFEITSWISQTRSGQASAMTVPPINDWWHNMQKALISTRPVSVTSHTVLVVDMSGSMREKDVGINKGSVTRAQEVYETLAQYLVKEQIEKMRHYHSGQRLPLDVVSLIEMRDEAEIVFEAIPIDSHLFNTLMERRKTCRPSSHGNYMPSLDAAERLLNKVSHAGCALLFLFLSDGRCVYMCC